MRLGELDRIEDGIFFEFVLEFGIVCWIYSRDQKSQSRMTFEIISGAKRLMDGGYFKALIVENSPKTLWKNVKH